MSFYNHRPGGLKMCIVENDELLRDSMALFFRAKGCHVLTFGNAEEALPVLESLAPDIVICDHGLPGMDGMKFLEGVGARHPATVKILIGFRSTTLLAGDAKLAGIDEAIQKPFSVDEIERALERRLRSRVGDGLSADGAGEVSNEEISR